jgi:hypothetical protein
VCLPHAGREESRITSRPAKDHSDNMLTGMRLGQFSRIAA